MDVGAAAAVVVIEVVGAVVAAAVRLAVCAEVGDDVTDVIGDGLRVAAADADLGSEDDAGPQPTSTVVTASASAAHVARLLVRVLRAGPASAVVDRSSSAMTSHHLRSLRCSDV